MEKQSYSFIEWAPFFLGLGIGSFFLMSGPPSFSLILGIGIALILILLFLKSKRISGLFFWKAGITAIVGFLLPAFHMKMNHRFWQVKRPIFRSTVQGKVTELSFSTERPMVILGAPLIIRFQTLKRPWKFKLKKGTIRVRWRGTDPLPTLGQVIEVPMVLLPIPPKKDPYDFDARRWAYFFRVVGKGFATGPPIVLKDGMEPPIQGIRQIIGQRIKQYISGVQGGLAAALIIGDRSSLPNKTRQQFVDAGIAHVLAISGLHLTLVAGLFFFALRRFLCLIPRVGLFYDTKKLAAPFALIAAFFYLLLSGFSISTQRAFIMLTVGLVAIWIDRPPFSKRSLMIAAILVLFYQPLALFMPSFHLSFFAVLALIEGYTLWKDRFVMRPSKGWMGKCLYYMQGVLVSSFIASIATIPFTLYHFQKMTLQSLGSNLVVIPLMAFWIMPLALLSMIFMPFGWEGPFLKGMGSGILLMGRVAEAVSMWPGSSILFKQLPPFSLGLMMVGSFFIFMLQRKSRFIGVFLLLLSFFGGMIPKPTSIQSSSHWPWGTL